MNCIRTGAKIAIGDYRGYVYGDVFKVGNCYVFNCNTRMSYDDSNPEYTIEEKANYLEQRFGAFTIWVVEENDVKV
jgi:hypothetical protein